MSLIIRPFESGDIDSVVNLWNRTLVADPINKQRLQSDFLQDRHFDADQFLLAYRESKLVGFVLGMSPRADLAGDNANGTGVVVGFGVDPANQRQGIATALFDELENLWIAQGVTRIAVGPWIPSYLTPGVDAASYPEALPFFANRSYLEGDHPISMRALLTGYRPASGVAETKEKLASDGIAIRPATTDEAEPVIKFAHNHFSHWESYVASAFARLAGNDSATTVHIAFDHRDVIGFALTDGERFGPFGVNEAYRGRGIGAVLLSQTLMAMRAANIHLAYFLWTSEQTSRLYSRHGFETVRTFTMMSKPIE